jgi:hypothetical protein
LDIDREGKDEAGGKRDRAAADGKRRRLGEGRTGKKISE